MLTRAPDDRLSSRERKSTAYLVRGRHLPLPAAAALTGVMLELRREVIYVLHAVDVHRPVDTAPSAIARPRNAAVNSATFASTPTTFQPANVMPRISTAYRYQEERETEGVAEEIAAVQDER